MKSSIQSLGVSFFAILLLAGCGGGGGSSPGTVPGGGNPTTGALDAGGTGVTTGQVADGSGAAVTAHFTNALDVNDLSQVIGFAEITAGAPFSAALWSVDSSGEAAVSPRALHPIAGNTFSAAFAIDERGTAVGQSADGARLVAVLWVADSGTPTSLPALTAAGNSKALGIAADGSLIVGEAQDATSRTRGVIWSADAQGNFTAPPAVLPFSAFASGSEPSRFSSANGVARVGAAEILAVGEAEAGDGTVHAALWRSTNDGATFTAGSLGADHIAHAVNNARQVVGESDRDLSPVAWAVSAQGEVSLPVTLAAAGAALAINEGGRIAGRSGAPERATVWNGPVPSALFDTVSQAYGLNNDPQPLVVGRNGSQGFVKRVN